VEAASPTFLPLHRQAELVRAGELSPRELVEAHLERIERVEPELNAFRVVLAERALAEADQATARARAGDERPLLGVPVAVKDNVDLAGEPTTYGTGAYGGPATEDSEPVRRLREAGAIVIGKTLLPELALWPFTESATWGVTRNPWNTAYSPGGSSGGSAAAVAAGMAAAALGSDGGASVRVPAACCNLFGLKSQRGRISMLPDREHWHGLTQFGPLARTVLDGAIVHDVLTGGGQSLTEAARRAPGHLRIAVSRKPAWWARIAPEMRDAAHRTAELLRTLGHEVAERDPDYGEVRPMIVPRYLRGVYDDARRMAHPDRLERRTRRMAAFGRAVSPALVARARAGEAARTRRINRIFEDFDVLLTPSTARPALELRRFEGRGAVWTFNGIAAFIPFTAQWNLTGQPAASVPAGFTDEGLPLGVQLVARPNDEETIVSLAAQLESERPWSERPPPL
jgi:amidase